MNPLIGSTTETMARNLRYMQSEIQKTLGKLITFNQTSVQVFSEIEDIYAEVQKGFGEVSSGNAWNAGTGTFHTSRLNLTWVSRINERIKSSEIFKEIAHANKSSDTIFKEHLSNQFGFEDEEIELMLKLRDKLEKKYDYVKQNKLDWYFTRLLGGFSYGEAGLGSSLWKSTAGDPYMLSTSFGLHEENYFIQFLGFTEAEYNLLRYKVRIQNVIVSNPEEYRWLEVKNDDYNRKTYKKSLEKVLDKKITAKEFEEYWINQYDKMVVHGDFAHQQITAATILNKNITITDTVENLSGWLGDAALNDSLLGAGLSFGNDDYKADLDAENIKHVMETETISYQDAVNKYYDEVGTLYTRAEMFKEHTSIEDVKKQVYTLLKASSIWVDDSNMDILKSKAPDTYNFLRSLEENNHEMGNYK